MDPQDWIGRNEEVPDALDPWPANALVATLGLERGAFAGGDALPPFWHWLHFREAAPRAALGCDGHPAPGAFMPPVGRARRMWAGGRLRFHAPLRLGAPATRRSTIADVTHKTGRSGALTFVTVRNEMLQDGAVAVSEEQDIVYRAEAAPRAARPAPEQTPAEATHRRDWIFDSVILFRYSALTFNGHRIHYDADYAREIEGYPGLVVHGPLLATLLLELAGEIAGPPARFAFRATAPVFAGEEVCVCAASGGTSLWCVGADGRLAMQAEAAW